MDIIRIGFPGILLDNDMQYIAAILNVVKEVDEDSRVVIIKTLESYSFDITPCNKNDIKILINKINTLHKLLGIPIEYSRSIKLSKSVNFFLK